MIKRWEKKKYIHPIARGLLRCWGKWGRKFFLSFFACYFGLVFEDRDAVVRVSCFSAVCSNSIIHAFVMLLKHLGTGQEVHPTDNNTCAVRQQLESIPIVAGICIKENSSTQKLVIISYLQKITPEFIANSYRTNSWHRITVGVHEQALEMLKPHIRRHSPKHTCQKLSRTVLNWFLDSNWMSLAKRYTRGPGGACLAVEWKKHRDKKKG